MTSFNSTSHLLTIPAERPLSRNDSSSSKKRKRADDLELSNKPPLDSPKPPFDSPRTMLWKAEKDSPIFKGLSDDPAAKSDKEDFSSELQGVYSPGYNLSEISDRDLSKLEEILDSPDKCANAQANAQERLHLNITRITNPYSSSNPTSSSDDEGSSIGDEYIASSSSSCSDEVYSIGDDDIAKAYYSSSSSDGVSLLRGSSSSSSSSSSGAAAGVCFPPNNSIQATEGIDLSSEFSQSCLVEFYSLLTNDLKEFPYNKSLAIMVAFGINNGFKIQPSDIQPLKNILLQNPDLLSKNPIDKIAEHLGIPSSSSPPSFPIASGASACLPPNENTDGTETSYSLNQSSQQFFYYLQTEHLLDKPNNLALAISVAVGIEYFKFDQFHATKLKQFLERNPYLRSITPYAKIAQHLGL